MSKRAALSAMPLRIQGWYRWPCHTFHSFRLSNSRDGDTAGAFEFQKERAFLLRWKCGWHDLVRTWGEIIHFYRDKSWSVLAKKKLLEITWFLVTRFLRHEFNVTVKAKVFWQTKFPNKWGERKSLKTLI
jgi:hypothetical protein